MAQRVVDGVVLVTGASSGIGAGIVARLHAQGARVIISGRDRARLESVAARRPGMSVVVMDVADPESVTRGLADVAAGTPHLTTLVNNAGIQRLVDFTAAEPPVPADIASEVAINFAGLINVTEAALRCSVGLLVRAWSTSAQVSGSCRMPRPSSTPRRRPRPTPSR